MNKRIPAIILAVCLLLISSAAFAQDISLKLGRVSVREAIAELQRSAG